MINKQRIEALVEKYNIPFEDILFIALNYYGIDFYCSFNRMRMGLLLSEDPLFSFAHSLGENNYYFALAVNCLSPFRIEGKFLTFDHLVVGQVIEPSEDFCDSNYPRRNGTVLNFNPNSRTSCRGCKFCYTGYQVSRDRKKVACREEMRVFIEKWMELSSFDDLSHLIQVAVVTGCYDNESELLNFLLVFNEVLSVYNFSGELFYLGSQITKLDSLQILREIKNFAYCVSLECFDRREELLRENKSSFSLNQARQLMIAAKDMGFRINFSYIVGLESLETIARGFGEMLGCTNSFPVVNIMQRHVYHSKEILDPLANDIEYFLQARKILESVFVEQLWRPRVWENYRSLWYLKFGEEVLTGIRTP